MSARMGLMDGDYPNPAARKIFYDRLLEQLRQTPEFGAVAFTSRFRMVFGGNGAGRDRRQDLHGAARSPERQLRAGHRRRSSA